MHRFLPQILASAFLLAVPCHSEQPVLNDEHWFAIQPAPSNGFITALAQDVSASVYVGGNFTKIASLTASNIARWNGTVWTNLGPGLNNQVISLALNSPTNVFAGGYFLKSGGLTGLSCIARWDGVTWTNLGLGVRGAFPSDIDFNVAALALDGAGNVYAGGNFTTAGTISARGIARWNGTVWTNLGSGVNESVEGLVLDKATNIYVCGEFTNAGGITARRIAKWNGVAWTNLGSGLSSNAYCIAIDGASNVYVGGFFTNAGGIAATNIAKWNGSSWTNLGSGLANGPNFASVHALALDGATNLYAGGNFTEAGGSPANYVAKWDGTSWTNMGSGFGTDDFSFVTTLLAGQNERLYVGGSFSKAGDKAASNIAFFVTGELEATFLQAAPAANGIILQWKSATGRTYRIRRSPDVFSAFTNNVATNLPATPMINIYTDTTPSSAGFYRVESE